jgi:hypothetical protein
MRRSLTMLILDRAGAGATLAALVSMLVVAAPMNAHGCACCVPTGTRGIGAHPLSSYEIDEIGKLAIGREAALVITEAFPDDIKGIVRPSSDIHAATGGLEGRAWRVTLTDKSGRKGTLALTLPARIIRREIDVPPAPTGAPKEEPRNLRGDSTLYKEWIFLGAVTGSGFFVPGALASAKAELILHGHGNGCPSGDDFHHWTLVVKGPAAAFTLHGPLTSKSP